MLDGIRVLAIATLVTLGGVLVVVGLLSTPLTMLEVDRFSGVQLVLAAPPLSVLVAVPVHAALGRDASRPRGWPRRRSPCCSWSRASSLLGAGYLVLARSGNQSDIAPSGFELALRAHLTTLLQVRPRFKEFVVGFPALMLAGALLPSDRARWGWLFALAIGVGLGDVVDTFSHLHTALAVSLLRLVNGAVIGVDRRRDRDRGVPRAFGQPAGRDPRRRAIGAVRRAFCSAGTTVSGILATKRSWR